MKTTTQVIGWLKANNYYDAMERNLKAQRGEEQDLASFIDTNLFLCPDGSTLFYGTFTFRDTPEGHDYWQEAKERFSAWLPRPMSQNEDILYYLMTGKTLTSLEALGTFGCLRLGARIADLRSRGYAIDTRMITLDNGKRIAEYKLYE